MFIACSHRRQRGGLRRRAIGPAAGAMVAALSLAVTGTARSDDGKAQGSTRIAAADVAADTLPYRLGMPLPRVILDVDLKVLLAQYRPATTKNDVTAGEDTILVAIVLGVPESVDEDIAKQYGLELLERTELPELGLRIVQFRVAGDRPTAPVLAELRNDQRIRRAQHNAQYTPIPLEAPALGSSRLNGPSVEANPAAADRKAPAVAAKVAQKLAVRPEAGSAGRSLKGSGPPPQEALQSSRVGDVLAGGL
jgi:hypothetical protein